MNASRTITWVLRRYLNPYSLLVTEAVTSISAGNRPEARYILTARPLPDSSAPPPPRGRAHIGANWDVYKKQSPRADHGSPGFRIGRLTSALSTISQLRGRVFHGGKDPAYQNFLHPHVSNWALFSIFRSHGSETPREIWDSASHQCPS